MRCARSREADSECVVRDLEKRTVNALCAIEKREAQPWIENC
jgi:hypothetical protein